MFRIGDRIVHPLHGAGVVEDLVERTIDGETARYYALRPVLGDTQLFIPTDACEKLGIRPVCSRERALQLLEQLDAVGCGEEKGWNQVIKSLAVRERERGLSAGEKKMLVSARQILCSELSCVLDITPQEAETRIDRHLSI